MIAMTLDWANMKNWTNLNFATLAIVLKSVVTGWRNLIKYKDKYKDLMKQEIVDDNIKMKIPDEIAT